MPDVTEEGNERGGAVGYDENDPIALPDKTGGYIFAALTILNLRPPGERMKASVITCRILAVIIYVVSTRILLPLLRMGYY